MIYSSSDIRRLIQKDPILGSLSKAIIVSSRPPIEVGDGVHIYIQNKPVVDEFQASWNIWIVDYDYAPLDVVIAQLKKILPAFVVIKEGAIIQAKTTELRTEKTDTAKAKISQTGSSVALELLQKKFDDLAQSINDRMLLVGPGRPGKDGKDGKDGVDGKDGKDGRDGTDIDATEVELGDLKDVDTYGAKNRQFLMYDGSSWIPSFVPQIIKGGTGSSVDADLLRQICGIDQTGEPMGHANRLDSIVAFDNATRIFSIAPVDSSFDVWVRGIKFTYTSQQSIQIPNQSDLYYIYFDSNGDIGYQTSFFTWDSQAMTAYLYWNAAEGVATYFGDERHGIVLDWQTHEYLHRTRGASLANGFGIQNYTITGDGSVDTDAQIEILNGTFFDEDLQVDIVHSDTPTPQSWEQYLVGPARIPVAYHTNNGWKVDAATDFPLKAIAGQPVYNVNTSDSWSTPEVDENKYFHVFIVATHNLGNPILSILGQREDTNISNAIGYTWNDLDLTDFPSLEFRPLYHLIYQHGAYGNAVNARLRKVIDIRYSTISTIAAQGGQGATGATGATGVAGLDGATGATGVAGSTGATGIQGAIGVTGATGVAGVTGATGIQGTVGEAGATGATGADGPSGATGATGVQGITGATGIIGVTGATGVEGPAGVDGVTGATGPVGATGATGPQGSTGPAGPVGSIDELSDVDLSNPASANGKALIYLDGKWIPGPVLGPKDLSTDDFYSSVTLLMRGNGTNGGTVFTDQSPTPKTFTGQGTGVVTSTANKKFGSSSIYKPTTSSTAFVQGTLDNAYNLIGNIDFTIECWINTDALRTQCIASYQDRDDNIVYRGWRLYLESDGKIRFMYGAASISGAAFNSTTNISQTNTGKLYTANTWHHIAVTRKAGVTDGIFRLFIDGILVGSTTNVQTVNSMVSSGYAFVFFKPSTVRNLEVYAGYLDDFRLTKGVCRYTATFAPPTQEAAAQATTGNGQIIYTIDALSDVDTSSTPPTINQTLNWDGSNWVPSSLAGPSGATGPTGVQGVTGATGVIGVTGATGVEGPAGVTGATGVQGPVGDTGATGSQGAIGVTGATGIQGPVGVTGATGIQGPQGATGATGVQGPVGATGATGVQGPVGVTGATGIQGVVGVTGATGVVGVTGATGVTGDKGGVRYAFSTTVTDADPGNGIIRYNNATIASVTQVFIDNVDGAGVSQASWYDTWDDSTTSANRGYLVVNGNLAGSQVVNIFRITGAVTAAAGYYKIPVAYVSGVLPANATELVISFSRTGDVGVTGATGVVGVTGATGVQGPVGVTGATGVQGPVGVTGATGIQGPVGVTGATGVQGPQGATGATGVQGIQGATGATGVQGVVGVTGATGVQGPVGVTGATGVVGVTGATGVTGDKGGVRYAFSTTITDADPGNGTIRYNNATIGSVTQIFIDNVDAASVSQTAWYDTWDDSTTTATRGYITIVGNTAASSVVNIFQVTGAVTVATGYYKIPVSYVSGALPVNAEVIAVGFSRTGNIGVTGATGVVGVTGATGVQGVVGVTGATGVQGVVGVTGATGIQGPVGVTGATGPQGAVGVTGATGVQGPVGVTGATGPVGATGPSIGVTTSALTFSSAGSGAASGTTFDGSVARTISYNSIGAPSTTGTNASGTWGISISGNSATTSGSTFSGDSATKDDITTRTESGFYESSTGTNAEGWPVNDGQWQHLIACTHSNDGNYYSMQIGASFFSQNLYFRNTNGSGSTAWSTLLHSGNYNSYSPTLTGTGASGSWGISVTGSSASCTGNAATATNLSSNRTFALTGDVTGSVSSDLSSGASIAASIASGVIVNDDINASAGIVDTKLATISTAGKVSNSATTATSANTANAIVARDANGNIDITSINSGQLAGFRNKIINGAMEVSQRGTSFAAVANSTYTLDRFVWEQVGAMVVTINQSTDVPDNIFQNSLHVDVTTVDSSLAGSDYAFISHKVEGYNVRDLIGKTFTLSFWVKSSKTGTHCVSFRNSGTDRAYVMTYSVSVANTWEFKTLTLSGGLITAGTWNWTTGIGLNIGFVLAVGANLQTTANAWQTGNFVGTSAQVNVMDNTANNFYITGVHLEVGGIATPFERRSIGSEFALCERYYKAGSAVRTAGTQALVYFSTFMRATPIVSVTTTFGSTVSVSGGNYTSFDGFRATVASGSGDFIWTASAEL